MLDYFNDVFTNFLGLEHGSCVAVYVGSECSQISLKKYLNLCSEDEFMGLMGLERHEGEQLMTEFSFWGKVTL